MIRVTGKGNKTRIVPVGSHAVQAIRHYLEIEATEIRRQSAAAAKSFSRDADVAGS